MSSSLCSLWWTEIKKIKTLSCFVNSKDNASFKGRNIQSQVEAILRGIFFQVWNLEAWYRILFEDNLTVSVDIKLPA